MKAAEEEEEEEEERGSLVNAPTEKGRRKGEEGESLSHDRTLFREQNCQVGDARRRTNSMEILRCLPCYIYTKRPHSSENESRLSATLWAAVQLVNLTD